MAKGSKTSQGLVTLVRSRSYQGYLGIKDQGTLLGIKESSLVYFYIQDIWSLVFIFVRLSDRSHGILGNPVNRGKLEYLFLYQGATALGSFYNLGELYQGLGIVIYAALYSCILYWISTVYMSTRKSTVSRQYL